MSILAPELNVKRLELLHEFVPQARRIAVLADPSTISTHAQLTSAARDLGVELMSRELACDGWCRAVLWNGEAA